MIGCWIYTAAEFSFISVGEKPPSDRGEPFDIPGARYSHHGGHCTFYALLNAKGFQDPILQRIAQMVDEAT